MKSDIENEYITFPFPFSYKGAVWLIAMQVKQWFALFAVDENCGISY